MTRQLISSGSPFEPEIGFSRAVRSGNRVEVSGTAPVVNGQTAGVGDCYAQTKAALGIIVKAHAFNLEFLVAGEGLLQGMVHALGINRLNQFVGLLMAVLMPDQNVNRHFSSVSFLIHRSDEYVLSAD